MSPNPGTENGKKKGGKALIWILCGIGAVVLTVLILILTGVINVGIIGGEEGPTLFVTGGRVVGENIALSDITDFYYTIDASTDPPHFQRYRFCVEDGKRYFYHETREGDHWPLRETDATVTGTKELTDEEWAAFLELIAGGTVTKREDSADAGDSGPFLYLYWKGDKSVWQVYSFASYGTERAFEAMCVELKEKT